MPSIFDKISSNKSLAFISPVTYLTITRISHTTVVIAASITVAVFRLLRPRLFFIFNVSCLKYARVNRSTV